MGARAVVNRRIAGWIIAVGVAALVGGAAVVLLTTDAEAPAGDGTAQSWERIVEVADGQTVQLWMWGGEEALNRYIDEEAAPRAAALGVTLERVPIDDTATAVARIAAELEAGRDDDGAVDLLWVNGKNFAQGKTSGLWLDDWVGRLPNTRYLDPDDPTLTTDFGVPTDGQEAPWSRAAFVFAHDTARTPDPPRSFAELADFAAANPGRVTYPAPPDFTGSAFVRQAVQALGEDEAFDLLRSMRADQWESGDRFPKDQPELERLFANGEIDLAMSYNPNFVDTAVRKGLFPETARPYVFEGGTLQNVSFLAVPVNAGDPEGAQVVANLLLSPELQALKLARVGIPTVVDLDRLEAEDASRFVEEPMPHRLTSFGVPLEELPADQVPLLDERWRAEVLP